MKRKWIGVLLGTAVLAAVAGGVAYASGEREVVLEFGMFTGSYWDVANANSFTIIDQAIETFEAAHPGVRIHYYSGVDKDDYSEWFPGNSCAMRRPTCLWSWAPIFTSLPPWAS